MREVKDAQVVQFAVLKQCNLFADAMLGLVAIP